MGPTLPSTTSHVYEVQIDCHYLLHVPAAGEQAPDVLVMALHGYGMNAQTMLDLALPICGNNRVVASLQAPNQFYLNEKSAHSTVGYNWGTRAHGTASIRLHHTMIRQVRRELELRLGIPSARTILLGFSQPVGYNYRFAATFPDEVAGIVGICGGVPKDWETGEYGQVTASLLHIAREEDEYFPAAVTADYERKLRTRAKDVEYHLLAGGHRFPSKSGGVLEPWLQRRFSQATQADERRVTARNSATLE